MTLEKQEVFPNYSLFFPKPTDVHTIYNLSGITCRFGSCSTSAPPPGNLSFSSHQPWRPGPTVPSTAAWVMCHRRHVKRPEFQKDTCRGLKVLNCLTFQLRWREFLMTRRIFERKETLWISQWGRQCMGLVVLPKRSTLSQKQTWLRAEIPSGLCCLLTDHLCGSPPPSPPRNQLSSPSITTPTILLLQSRHSTCSSPQIPPSGSTLSSSSVLSFCHPSYGCLLVNAFPVEGAVVMVPQVAPAIPCGAADLPLPFVQSWFWHLINLGSLLPEKYIADDDFRASILTLEWQVYVPAGNSIGSHTLYLCMHGPNVHS